MSLVMPAREPAEAPDCSQANVRFAMVAKVCRRGRKDTSGLAAEPVIISAPPARDCRGSGHGGDRQSRGAVFEAGALAQC